MIRTSGYPASTTPTFRAGIIPARARLQLRSYRSATLKMRPQLQKHLSGKQAKIAVDVEMANRGVGKTLTPTKRGAILAQCFFDRKNGPTVRQIADMLNVSKCTMQACRATAHCPKRGRESETERERCRLIAHYLRYPIHTADASAELENRVVAGNSEQPEVPPTRLVAEEEVPLSELLAAAKPRVSTGRPQALKAFL
ncbi:hypothetical protein FN846DRAFT_205784 [Sphaerosporella brunnea]|uniref:Uncharacterized protein n=1 Tax=Sphaerosporella brunnea TaxID=1250544 RepID=A0A5J5EQJ1_9PEZI|nr:hypothetical protein FN846DRAFT_205784 [Sphaerosporella brunnea]